MELQPPVFHRYGFSGGRIEALMVTYAGVQFKNPFVVASSPLTAKVDLLKRAEEAGAAGASTKLTLLRQPFQGRLRMYSDPRVGSIVCHDQRLNLQEGFRLVTEAKQATSLVLLANITHQGDDLEGWATLARAMEEAGADLIEANLVCPNMGITASRMGAGAEVGGGALAGQNPALAREITRTLKQTVRIPVVCKLTPNVTDVTEVARACREGGADGLTLAGAHLSLPPVDVYEPERVYPLLKGASLGSLGGPACRLLGYAAVAQVATAVELPIIGGGGIENWQHAVEYLMWGATLVTACTSIMWHGWEVVTRLVRGVERFAQEQGYSSCADITGRALSNLRPNSLLEPLPGAPRVDPTRCNGCGVCLKPAHCQAITLQDQIAVVSEAECLGCGICVAICPRHALQLP